MSDRLVTLRPLPLSTGRVTPLPPARALGPVADPWTGPDSYSGGVSNLLSFPEVNLELYLTVTPGQGLSTEASFRGSNWTAVDLPPDYTPVLRSFLESMRPQYTEEGQQGIDVLCAALP